MPARRPIGGWQLTESELSSHASFSSRVCAGKSLFRFATVVGKATFRPFVLPRLVTLIASDFLCEERQSGQAAYEPSVTRIEQSVRRVPCQTPICLCVAMFPSP